MKINKCFLSVCLLIINSVYAVPYGGNASSGWVYLFSYEGSVEDSFFKGSSSHALLESTLYLGKMQNGVCKASGNFIQHVKTTTRSVVIDVLDVDDIYNLGNKNCVVSKIKNYENGKCFLFGAKLIVQSNVAVGFEEQSIYHMNC